MSPSSIMVFAAGFGTRMRELTRDRPKALIEVAGETLLDRTLRLTEDAGLRHRVVNTHYLGEQIERHLAGKDIAISHETPKILDTGGGLKAALPKLGTGPVFTANSDAVFRGENPFSALARSWDPNRMEALLLLVPPTRAIGRSAGGDFEMLGDGRLQRGGRYVYSGVQVLRTDRIAREQEEVFSLNQTWDAMILHDGLFGMVYPGFWCDVGHPEGISLAEKMIAANDP